MAGSEDLDGYYVLYFPWYITASLPMMFGPKAQALSYHVSTKYSFLPNSQAQLLEIPYFMSLWACLIPNHRVFVFNDTEQGWELSPLNNVVLVRFRLGTIYVRWVCCWFLTCSEGFFSGFSGFPPFIKTNISKFQFDQERGPAWKPRLMWLPL